MKKLRVFFVVKQWCFSDAKILNSGLIWPPSMKTLGIASILAFIICEFRIFPKQS